MIIDSIKEFLKTKGFNWTGQVISHSGKTFRPATIEDFNHLGNMDFLIDFGDDGEIAISIEIDYITFKIYGESFNIAYSKNAGDNKNIKKLIKSLDNKDLSKEFIKFQLENSGLVYALAVKEICQEKTNQVNDECERRINHLKRKIEYLTHSVEKVEEARKKQIKEIEKVSKLAEDYNC